MDFPYDKYYLKDYNEDSTDHIRSTALNQSSSNFTPGSYKGTWKSQINFQFHGAYLVYNLIVTK